MAMPYALNLIYLLGLGIAWPWLLVRAWRTGRYRRGWSERLWGHVPPAPPGSRTLWLHAVSVGEVQVLRPLIAELHRAHPDSFMAISTTTDAGYELAKKLFPDAIVFYLPIDFSWAMSTALRRLQPQWLVLAELEAWPNLIAAAKRLEVPVAIINGRLSERSFQGYRRWSRWLRPMWSRIDLVAAQSTAYAQRFVDLGVSAERVHVTGNLKFDGATLERGHEEVIARRRELGLSDEDLVWVVGSTQAPEERWALEVLDQLRPSFPQLRLVLVPRHPDRFEEVARWLESRGVGFRRRSQPTSHTLSRECPVLLGDTVGELRWWWGLADVGLVGGSFGDRGGQSMIEPAGFGVSCAFGPKTKNFRDVVRLLLDADAAIELSDERAILPWMREQLGDAVLRQRVGDRAQALVKQQQGATARTLALLEQLRGSTTPNT